MKNLEMGGSDPEAPKQKEEVIIIERDGKKLVLSHVNNQFFPKFAFFKDEGTDDTTTVAWENLKEEERKKIIDHLQQPTEKESNKTEKTYSYDRKLYLTLSNPPSDIRKALGEQAMNSAKMEAAFSGLTGRTEAPESANLLEEVAMGIAIAKKKGEEYGRTFMPDQTNSLIFSWLGRLSLKPKKYYDRISVDFRDQKE